MSDDQKYVLISHLGFFGKRRDIEIKLEEIESLSSIEELKEKFVKLKLNDSDGHMLISLPYGYDYNKNKFLKIFKID